jgi:transposase
MASLSTTELVGIVRSQAVTIDSLKHQLEWFKNQMFGTKSERLSVLPDAKQLALGEILGAPPQAPLQKKRTVAAHTRRVTQRDAVGEGESVPFFDETRVPIETIVVANPRAEGLTPDQFQEIGKKVSYRLAQRPGSYVVLKYVRSIIKVRETQVISCPPAPQGVIEGSRADVSFIAGLIVDKMSYYLPLYRQHQRLEDSGIDVSRGWLTQLVQKGIGLLEPIYEAQLDSIRESRVKAMDETPIKAGRTGHGKMKTAYYWPIYGERDESAFPTSLRALASTCVLRWACSIPRMRCC